MKKLYMVLAVVFLMVNAGCNKGSEDATNQANLDQANQNQAYPNQVPAGTGNSDNQNSLPPPIYFAAPPEVVPLADTDVYIVPDVQEEIFFYGGWWWRPWQGRWYHSHYYDRGWGYYRGEPIFHRHFYEGWRDDYRNHRWRGQQWDYQRVPGQDLDRNWRTWEKNRYWRGGGHGRRDGRYTDFQGERKQGFQDRGQQGMQGNRGGGQTAVKGNRVGGQQGMQGNRGGGQTAVKGNRVGGQPAQSGSKSVKRGPGGPNQQADERR